MSDWPPGPDMQRAVVLLLNTLTVACLVYLIRYVRGSNGKGR